MTVIELRGCRLRPIGSYLKALGILRIVGEQLDPDATGSWVGDFFRLESIVDADALVDFFVDGYSPTPLVSPWNGGSGYSPNDKAARGAIDALMATTDVRFADYQDAIGVAQRLVADPHWKSGGKDAKQQQIARCRASLPDRAVDWLDASVVLANDRLVFPPIFGSGGNDGRLEFSSNFMQRLVELFVAPPKRGAPDVTALARDALLGEGTGLVKGSSGQYDPNSVEPSVTAASGRTASLSNPWDLVLLIEGGLVFASAAARRLGTSTTMRAAMPFCVDTTPVGSASTGEAEDTRGEIWTPVWRSPATIAEISRLVGEGRARWGSDQAGTGVDFAKAVASLGVDRGIDRFIRHGIVQRYGLSYFAVPLDEVVVGARPEIDLLQPVDHWLRQLKRQLPAAAASARRRVEAAEYRAATDTSTRPAGSFQQVLIELAALEHTLARSADRNETRSPVGGGRTALPADDWLPVLDDGTPEFRLAVSLASSRDPLSPGELDDFERTAASLALSFRPVELDERARLVWSPGPPRVDGLGHRPIDQLLADALVDREIRVGQRSGSDDEHEGTGVDLWFKTGITTSLDDLLDLAEGRIDLDRLGALFQGLLLLGWRPRAEDHGRRYRPVQPSRPSRKAPRTSPAMATLLPFFHGQQITAARADGTKIERTLKPQSGWARRLAIGRIDDVLDDAVHRLRIAGLRPAVERVRPTTAEASGALVIAAVCRVHTRDIEYFIRQICPSDAQQRADAEASIDNNQEDQ